MSSIANFLDICDIQGGTQPPKSEWLKSPAEGYVRMLQIRDFTQPKKENIEYVKDKPTLKKCTEKDILIGRYGASLGKILTGLSGAYNVAMAKVIFDNDKIDSSYLYNFLNGDPFQRFINKVGGRAAQAGFNKQDLERLQLPLPPLPEQRRIADILDKADSIRRKRQEAIALSEEFLRSVFLDMFGDPVTNPKGWDVKEIREVAHLKIGPFGSLLHKEDYVESGIPLVNPKHMKDLKIIPDSKVSITREKHDDLRQYHLAEGDIIMARRGDIGRCALVTKSENGYLCGTGSLFLRPNSSITPQYLLHLISSEALVTSLTNCAKGVTMLNLNAGAVGKLNIPVPSIEKQLEFSSIIKTFKAFQNKLASGLRDADNLSESALSNLLS